MSSKLPLDTLIELASERTDQAARRLAELLKAQAGAAEKLALLQQYRDEYLARLHERMRAGLPASELRNFQLFVATLDGAIEQQRALAQQAEARLAQGRSHWQDSRRRLGAFDTLAGRMRSQQALAAGRQEQREGDERSATRFQLRSSAFAS
ncbi:flagellar export protein FliJ [Ramlibacter tataouinensis]|uniref:flagellar export protein FliJ n=1 Tax=Ramlibacter tataouinensis TaxID=94132 RepID=UPI0022F3B5C1|nr:flagellar export protein FliJ [Ramlibacter tataouinensis]WBY00614.1 flagellar export protein FliJ [Ramlibacter tataouinensis]